jgi:hypothetical protein
MRQVQMQSWGVLEADWYGMCGGDYHEGSEQLKSGIDGQIKIEVAKINDYWGR